MNDQHRYARAIELLRAAKLRPTRQRMALARLLFASGHRHVTAEALHAEALAAQVRVSLATVYNALHRFTASGLLREVVVDGQRSCFDTNTADHQHFFIEEVGQLQDIPAANVQITGLPAPPPGTSIRRVDVIVRVTKVPG